MIILSEHHHDIQLQNLSISDTLACATCQIQFIDRTEQVLIDIDKKIVLLVLYLIKLDTAF